MIYEFGRAFALACFGQLNRRLWIRGGNSDITLLACNAEKEHIDKLDIDSDLGKYFVSVNPSHYTTGCLNENDGPTKKTVVCLPHLYEHKIVETIEIAKSQLDILLRQCILDGYMTKVSLHPVCDIDEYKWIEQELGLEISTLPVEQEIVDADIVVSQPSGCLMYALSNNVKALVLECWNIDFPLEDRLLMKVKKIDEIRHGLAQLACIEGMRGLNTNRNAALDKLIGDMVEILMRQGYVNNRVVKRLRNGLELDRLSL